MTSKEELYFLRRLVKDIMVQSKVSYGYSLKNIDYKFNEVEKDLDLLDSIKEVFKKVIYAPYNAVDFDNKVVPIPKVKVAEDFDKELFRQVLDQCGFEIKEK